MNRSTGWILVIAGAVLVGIVLVCLAGGLLFPWNRAAGPAAVAPEPLQASALHR
jgi:hypothetical protein